MRKTKMKKIKFENSIYYVNNVGFNQYIKRTSAENSEAYKAELESLSDIIIEPCTNKIIKCTQAVEFLMDAALEV